MIVLFLISIYMHGHHILKLSLETAHYVSFICSLETRDVAALVMSHMNGLQPFESSVEQTTETMPLALKQ